MVDYYPKVIFFFRPEACRDAETYLTHPDPEIVRNTHYPRYLSFDCHKPENKERLVALQTEIQASLRNLLFSEDTEAFQNTSQPPER